MIIRQEIKNDKASIYRVVKAAFEGKVFSDNDAFIFEKNIFICYDKLIKD